MKREILNLQTKSGRALLCIRTPNCEFVVEVKGQKPRELKKESSAPASSGQRMKQQRRT